MTITIDDVKNQITSARQQAQTQREQVAEKRKETAEFKEKLQEQKEKIPNLKSQRLLRSTNYSGLVGRRKRILISGTKGKISEKEKQAESFLGELSKFEKEQLEPFEKEIKERESEVTEYEKQQKSLDLAKKVYFSKSPFAIFSLQSDPLAQKYYRMISYKPPQEVIDIKPDVKVNPFTTKPIYSPSGELVGVEDPFTSTSRIPTIVDKFQFGNLKQSSSISIPKDLVSKDSFRSIDSLNNVKLNPVNLKVNNLLNNIEKRKPLTNKLNTIVGNKNYNSFQKNKIIEKPKKEVKLFSNKKESKKSILYLDNLFSKKGKKKSILEV